MLEIRDLNKNFSGFQAKVSGLVPNLRVSLYHPFDFYNSGVVVGLEVTPIVRREARLIAAGTAEERNKT